MLRTLLATIQTVMGSSLSQQSAVDTISQWSSRPSNELIFDAGHREISQYLQAVDRLLQSRGFDQQTSTAMNRLRGEFVAVLSRHADYQAGPASITDWSSVADSTANVFRYEDYVVSEKPSDDVITYLKNIAERMNSGGKLTECMNEYKRVRKALLTSHLKRQRFEELSKPDVTRRTNNWEKKLKERMEQWVQVSKICVKILFKREKQLCEQIFEGAAKDECFVGTVERFALYLFGFAEAMNLSNLPFERMEAILGLYEAFVFVSLDAEALFTSEPGEGIRNSRTKMLSEIEGAVGRMLHDFEDAVIHEATNACDDRGEVCQLTRYVMEKIDLLVRNKTLLTDLIKSTPLQNFGDLSILQEDLGHVKNHSILELHLILIIVVLQKKLETKSRSYQDSSLGLLFMINNIHYIVQNVEASQELQRMIGDSYLNKFNDSLTSAKNAFQTSICAKFLACFEDEGLYIARCFKTRPSRTAVRKRLSDFNAVFKEARRHSSWTIPDSQLREKIRVSVSTELVPAYENFLQQFASNPKITPILEQKKHSAADLEALITQNLFPDPEVTG